MQIFLSASYLWQRRGKNLVVFIDLESSEYNGRWYTDVKAWKNVRHDSSLDNKSVSAPVSQIDVQSDEIYFFDNGDILF